MLARYSDLQDRFRLGDGYSIELKTGTVLQGLGFKTADFERPTETFSGGWQMRIALAKLLLGQPNLLLLDEPTNHLDLEARNWLEDYLNEYPHAVILVSHDRFFLDAVVTRIADLDAAHAHRLLRQLQPLSRRARSAPRAAAQSQARTGRRSRPRQDVHRSVPLPGDQGVAGAEPDQGARKGRADRGAARAQEDPLRFSRSCGKSGRTVLELKHVDKAYGELRGVPRSQPAHRARRSDRAGRPERRRQVDADADAVGRGSARSWRTGRRPPRRDAVFRAGRSDANGSGADRLRDAAHPARRCEWCR